MIRTGVFAAIVFLAVAALNPGVRASQGPAGGGDDERHLTGGKVVTPPEKLAAISIPETKEPITIDGHVSEEAWKHAAVFKDFYQTAPGYNTEPSRRTEVYMVYDEHNLYVAFKCWDEKDKIRATVASRDNVFGEDNVRMWLDTFNDKRRAYVLGFNPLGIQQDGIYTEGQGADFTVDIVMESKGVIEDWGWSVEVKIPFKSLRYEAGKGRNWGFSVARNIDRFNDEFDEWLPDNRDDSGFLSKHGHITGLDDVKYEHTLEVVPSVTLGETGERVPAVELPSGRFVNHPVKKDIGVNLKYTLSPSMTLDAAINPDFAEIEADAPVVTANQRFPIFFDEKRPFFLEGKEIFDSPLQIFYSRTIVDPDYAFKLTGKHDKTSYGFLAASDNAPGNYSEDERTANRECLVQQLKDATVTCPDAPFIDKNAYFAVARVKQDFGSNNNIGVFATARVFPQDRNFVGGFDGRVKFNPATTMTFQAVATHTLENFYDPNTDTSRYRNGNGLGYFWSLDYTKDTHGWYGEIFGRTRDYRADAGFTKRVNSNQGFFAYRESTKSRPKDLLIRLNFNQFVRYTFDFAGRNQYWLTGASVNAQLQGNLSLYLEGGDQAEHLYEEEFGARRNPATGLVGAFFGAPQRKAHQPYLNFNSNKIFNKKINGYLNFFAVDGSFDYDFGGGSKFQRVSPAYLTWLAAGAIGDAPGLDPGAGNEVLTLAGFQYKPIDPWQISLEYTHDGIRRHDTHQLAYATNIYSLKSTYSFTRFLFVRARLDYNTLNSNAAGQLLFGWTPSPGTAFYAGYNDNVNYNGFNPYTGRFEPGLDRNGRTLFIRASYLFRKSF